MVQLTAILLLAAAVPPVLEGIEVRSEAFGRRALLVVADLPRPAGEESLLRALDEVRRIEALTDPQGQVAGGLGRLNAAAGGGAVEVDAHLAEVLDRALGFCHWSEGAHGPTGGRLYALRGPGRSQPPPPEALAEALPTASCDHLRVDREAGTASLAAGGRLDLATFAAGFAADRAVAVLEEAGAGNGLVEVGGVTRAFGPGPGGRGWPVSPPRFRYLSEPLKVVMLENQALAVASRDDGHPYLDLRHGRPVEGVVASLAVTELGVDAQALAATMFIIGSRRGQMQLGNLRPRPSVLWLLGEGDGRPLLVDYRWSEISR